MPPPCHLPALSPCSPCAEHAGGGTARPPLAPQLPRGPQGPRVPHTSTDRRGLARCWAEGRAGSGSAKDALLLTGSGRGAPAGTGWALGLRFFLRSSILEGLPELRDRHPRGMDARLLAAPSLCGASSSSQPQRGDAVGLGGLQQGSTSCGGARWVAARFGSSRRAEARRSARTRWDPRPSSGCVISVCAAASRRRAEPGT